MNRLLEQNMIQELTCGSNFVYKLTNSHDFVMTDYKVLQSQVNNGFIRCMKITHNGKTGLFYKADEYKSFAAIMESIDPETFITIISSLISDIIEVRNNGFLSCQNIDISWDKVFVDTNTLKVRLVYMPVSVKAYEDDFAFENELRTGLVKLINNVPGLMNDKVMTFSSDLSNGLLTLEDLYRKMNGKRVSPKPISTCGTGGNQSFLKIIAMNAPKHFEIKVDREEMILGKKAELVDAVIPFNKMISRVHCKITKENGTYYLTDLGSANGTYINNVRIVPKQGCQVKRGDIIRLANSDFQVI